MDASFRQTADFGKTLLPDQGFGFSAASSGLPHFGRSLETGHEATIEHPLELKFAVPDCDELLTPEVLKGVQPTSHLEAHMILSDQSQRNVWLQTNVVELSDSGFSIGFGRPSLVLELREHSEKTAELNVVVEVSRILAVHQETSPSLAAAPFQFSVVLEPSADLIGKDPGIQAVTAAAGGGARPNSSAKAPRRMVSRFHHGEKGEEILRFTPGASPALQKQALRFFDELRILAFFIPHGTP